MVKDIIEKNLRKTKQIVHGARAVNIQVSEQFRRPTEDYDIFSRNTKSQATKLAQLLNKAYGNHIFTVENIRLTDSNQIIFRVVDRYGRSVADFMLTPRGITTVTIDGIRYESLAYAKKIYKKILSNPALSHRWSKASYDLQRIEQYEESIRGGKNRRDILQEVWSDLRWQRPMSQMWF